MDRREIKELAKAKVKGNKWNIWWPFLIISIITSTLQSFFQPHVDVNTVEDLSQLTNMTMTPTQSVGMLVCGIITAVLVACYLKYLLTFVRTGKFDTDEIINTLKEKWANLLIAAALVSIITAIGYVLFVIPGIILTLAYSMVMFIVIDSDTKGSDALKKSREMMKGYKGNYFVFILSFIGWFILTPFTLCILLIWLIPYLLVSEVIYYDKLKEKQGV